MKRALLTLVVLVASCGDDATSKDATATSDSASGDTGLSADADADGVADVAVDATDGADGEADADAAGDVDASDATVTADATDAAEVDAGPTCGNGEPDPGEACDDGNEADLDGCDRQCHASAVVRHPLAGEVVVSELMIDPAAVPDPRGEWIELTSVAGETLNLGGCELVDDGTDRVVFDPDGLALPVAAGGRVVAALSGDDAVNGGFEADFVYATMLLDNVADEVALVCDGVVIDRVAWTPFAWPVVSGRALSLDPSRLDAAADDAVGAWCLAERAYGDGDRGTPGLANASCPQLDQTIDACRLLIGATPSGFSDAPASLDVEVREAGVTDATEGVDASPALVVEVGWGPSGSSPEGLLWTWSRADGSEAVSAASGADGYRGAITVGAAGAVDVLGRASRDGGATWRLCDRAGALPAVPTAFVVQPTPCRADSCESPPAAACADDGVTLAGFEPVGRCVPKTTALFECSYEPLASDCGASGTACADGACGAFPRRPAAGDVVIDELMLKPSGGAIGQWVELESQVDEPLLVTGCVLEATDSESTFPFTLALPTVIGKRGRLVVGASSDLEVNGGAAVDRAWGEAVLLDAAMGTLSLRCDGDEVDAVVWDVDDGWTVPTGAALSLSPFRKNLDDDDLPTSWCAAQATFGDGDRGTPGAANAACPGDVVPVESCAILGATSLAPPAGTTATLGLKVIARSVTGKTSKTDVAAKLRMELGVVPRGAGAGAVASWSAASADLGWIVPLGQNIDGAEDRYLGSLRVPAPGAWDVFARATADGGNTWLACGGGAPVALDPVASACEPDPCGAPPPPSCFADEPVVRVESQPSTCSLVAGGGYACTFSATRGDDCGALGALCEAGQCTRFPRAPEAGELVVSELMIAPAGSELGEWIELTNPGDEPMRLGGCELRSGPAERWTFPAPTLVAPLADVVMPGEAMVVARSLSPVINGGAQARFAWSDLALGNSADWVQLVCDGTTIDTVAWDVGDGWSVPAGRSLQLSGAHLDAAANDFPSAFCAPAAPSPTVPNLVCPSADATLEACVLDAPATADAAADEPFSVGVRIVDLGVTDLRAGPDPAFGTLVDIGLGPADEAPLTSYDWHWSEAAPDADALDDTADRWATSVVAGTVGELALAARVSLDGGAHWTLCDRSGLDDGFAPDAFLSAEATACIPNPCTSGAAPTCSGGSLVAGADPGVCSVDAAGDAACSYATLTFSCGPFGGCNINGTCNAAIPRPAAAGDLVISEVMRDSTLPAPDAGEWIELTNPTATPFDIRGCVLTDGAGEVVSVERPLPDVVPAGGWAVFAQATDKSQNGGVQPTSGPVRSLAGMTLGNAADTVIVVCNGHEIDRVSWGLDWPGATGVAMQLDRAKTSAALNDDKSAWCAAGVAYGILGNKGSPGLSNPSCPP
ncbi:MAG: lamin tail domain-containing protein [Myxococcota bacterium]